jgi:hypothetical protein
MNHYYWIPHVFDFSFKSRGIKYWIVFSGALYPLKQYFPRSFMRNLYMHKNPGNHENGIHGGARKGGVDKI